MNQKPLFIGGATVMTATLVDDARARGAKIVIGGERRAGRGYFYPLTVVADATQDFALVKEEQFGPVIPVVKYSTVDEAVRLANALDVGLGGARWHLPT